MTFMIRRSAKVIVLLCLTANALIACGEEIDPNLLPIEFNDAALEQCIRNRMAIYQGDILRQDAKTLSTLECTDLGIQNIQALEHFTNLQDLALFENTIVDITPLANVTSLIDLQLGNNKIASITPLAGLSQLRRLGLFQNRLTSIDHLASLLELEWLTINGNQITSVAILTQLKQLTWVALEGNPLSNNTTVNSLRIRGVEVYDGTEIPLSKSSNNIENGFSDSLVEPQIQHSTLSLTLKKEDEVQFECVLDGQTQKAHHEFGGSIWLVNGFFEYQLGDSKRIIGEGTQEAWEICSGEYAHQCRLSLGVKLPNTNQLIPSAHQAPKAVCSIALSLKKSSPFFSMGNPYPTPSQDKELIQYVLASPNQLDGGTCLFMSNTGAMEILMHQHLPESQWQYEGETDLSERYLINASNYVPRSVADYSITDVIYTYNYHQGSLLNSFYPFTMGNTGDGLSCQINWEDELPSGWQDHLVPTPEADRTVLFIDPNLTSQSIWNVGLIGDDVVERIKYELRSKNAPVIVVYNHYLYWHADIVVGYDDNATIGECPMVKESVAYFKQQGHTGAASKIEDHLANEGGCSDKGIFYVRDSIYEGGEEEYNYDYGGQYHAKYSKRIIERTYDWVKYLGNHSYTVHRR